MTIQIIISIMYVMVTRESVLRCVNGLERPRNQSTNGSHVTLDNVPSGDPSHGLRALSRLPEHITSTNLQLCLSVDQ